jgi:hypothetical protein
MPVESAAASSTGRGLFFSARPRGRAGAPEAFHGAAEQLLHLRIGQQAVGRLLQRRVMRHGAQAEFPDQLGHVLQQRDHAAVVLPLVRLEHEQGEELVLGELVWAEPVGIRRERPLGDRQRFQRHLPW